MPVTSQTITVTVKSLADSIVNLSLQLSSLSTTHTCPKDLSSIQAKCAGVKSSLFSFFGALSLNLDVLQPLLSIDGQLSHACDWTLTSIVITLSYLEAETSRLFKKLETTGELEWQDDFMTAVLLRIHAEQNALDAIHGAVMLHNGNMVLETLTQNETLFDNIRHTLPSIVRTSDRDTRHQSKTFSTFSNIKRERGFLPEEVISSLVYHRVTHQLSLLEGEKAEEPRVDSLIDDSSDISTQAHNASPVHAGEFSFRNSFTECQVLEPAQTDLVDEENDGSKATTGRLSTRLPSSVSTMDPRFQYPIREESDSVSHGSSSEQTSYFDRYTTSSPRHVHDHRSQMSFNTVPDLGDENLPEVVPAYLLEKMPAQDVVSPGSVAPELVSTHSRRVSAMQSSISASRRHMFHVKKPNSSPTPTPSVSMRRRESSVSNTAGEGVWMYWLNDHVETFGSPEMLAPMQELYLTIPLVGDPAVQKSAAVERWLKQKSPTPPKFKKDEIVVEGLADDGEGEVPLKVTFTTLSKRKNIDNIQKIFVGEAVYAVCLFNIADAKTLSNAVNEWIPLIRRSSPGLEIILCALGPGGGAIRPGARSETIEDLERISSEDSSLGDKKAKSGYISFVSRGRGFAAAKSVGACAYFECSELSCGDLDRMFSSLIGSAAAARMQNLANVQGIFTSPRGSTASATFVPTF